jgi:thioredoxin-like negative regulator of GroEL
VRKWLLVLLLFPALAAFAGEAKWEDDWDSAFARARRENRPVFVNFYATWCHPCRFMDETVFPTQTVSSRLDKFVLLKIDGDDDRYRMRLFGVKSYPTYLVFDPAEQPRFRLYGTRTPEAMASALDAISGAMPEIQSAAALLKVKPAAAPHLSIGRTYFRLGLYTDARNEFDEAKKLATKAGDKILEQAANGQLLLTRAMEGKAADVLPELEKIAAAPLSSDNAIFNWMALARVRALKGDDAGSRDALKKASAAAPDDETRRMIAEAAAGWE